MIRRLTNRSMPAKPNARDTSHESLRSRQLLRKHLPCPRPRPRHLPLSRAHPLSSALSASVSLPELPRGFDPGSSQRGSSEGGSAGRSLLRGAVTPSASCAKLAADCARRRSPRRFTFGARTKSRSSRRVLFHSSHRLPYHTSPPHLAALTQLTRPPLSPTGGAAGGARAREEEPRGHAAPDALRDGTALEDTRRAG